MCLARPLLSIVKLQARELCRVKNPLASPICGVSIAAVKVSATGGSVSTAEIHDQGQNLKRECQDSLPLKALFL